MRVLVTGAAGFIGWNLTRLLLVRGHAVTAMVQRPADAARFGKLERVVVGDVTRRDAAEAAAKDVDAIVHLALPSADAKLREAIPVWREGTTNLLAVARERGLRSFVHASGAGGTYDHAPGSWVDETSPEVPFTGVTRARSKADAMVRAAHGNDGLRTAILRPSLVYGRGGPFQKYFVDLIKRGKYRVVGDGTNYLPLIHVQDCVKAYALAMEKRPAGDTFLLADDAPVTLRTISDVVADALGTKRPGHAPRSLARLVVGRDAVTIITESFRIRNAKLKDRLGWSPAFPSLREGISGVIP